MMVNMTNSLSHWLFEHGYQKEMTLIMFGHTELLTKDMWDRYTQWCESVEGRRWLETQQAMENDLTEKQKVEAICKIANIREIEDLSDGYHTFRQLYYQRMMLFATIVKQNRDRAWKSLKHEDGELCFSGGWFIVGVDTPQGSYTYHYESCFYSLFDCQELDRAKHWDGHTEEDVTRLLSLEQEPKTGHWIDREIYDSDRWRCSKCGFEWQAVIYSRTCNGRGCPNCSKK